MSAFPRTWTAEAVKLRRSPALRLVWMLPVLYLVVEFFLFGRPLFGEQAPTPKLLAAVDPLQVRMLVGLWGGFFHPLLLALLPALLFRPEHRGRTWRHLHAMPVSRRTLFLVKALWTLLLSALALLLLGLFLQAERRLLMAMNPSLHLSSQLLPMAKVLGWLWLGSLPVLALYLWLSDRINSLAVPVVLGLAGLLLTIALMGQETPQPWRRDLIPWVLPYAATERIIHTGFAQQEHHLAAKAFEPEPDVLRLPSGKKVRTRQNVPDHVLFPPPAPTPTWLLTAFSLGAGVLLLALGLMDANRDRA